MAKLTVARRDEEVVREGRQGTNHRSVEHFVLLVLEVKEALEHLVHSEVRGVRWDAAARDDLSAFPET